MGYAILPALIPDIPQVYTVYFSAFASDPITHALFPSASTPDLLDASSSFRAAHTAHVTSYWHTSATQYTLKCVDTDTNEIVGMALWDVYPTREANDWKKGAGIEWLEGDQRKRAEQLVMPLWDAREKLWKGERYVYCHVMAVSPQHQRKGVGKHLLQWGLDLAAQADLPIYLESSRDGHGLYAKMGFKELSDKVVHKKEVLWSGSEKGDGHDYTVPLMVWVKDGSQRKLPDAVTLAG